MKKRNITKKTSLTCKMILIMFVLSTALKAQTIIPIETAHNILVLQTDMDSSLISTYFGEKLSQAKEYGKVKKLDTFKPGNDDLYNQRLAYVSAGSLNLLEPALSVTHADGNKSLVLHYIRHEVTPLDDNQTLTRIYLKDPRYPFQVTLCYQSFTKENLIEQWTEISHQEDKDVILNKYGSANLTLSGKSFFLKNHHSGWGREMLSEEQQLLHGIRTLDSKLGTRNNLLLSSSFMVSINQPATETQGEVIAG